MHTLSSVCMYVSMHAPITLLKILIDQLGSFQLKSAFIQPGAITGFLKYHSFFTFQSHNCIHSQKGRNMFHPVTHPNTWVALPLFVPSTHHSHHPSPSHSFIPGLKPSFSANPYHQTVYRYFRAYPFLLFSSSFLKNFLAFGSVR